MRALTPQLLTYIVSFLAFVLFQLAYSIGKLESYQHDKLHAISAIEKQVTGDLDKLPLANERLHIMGRPIEIENYIYGLNQSLAEKDFPVSVLHLVTDQQPQAQSNQLVRVLTEQEQTVWLILTDDLIPFFELFSLFPILGALAVYWFSLQYRNVVCQVTTEPEVVEQETLTWLQVNLKEKKLINLTNDNAVDIANKPLCFFSALVDYCQQNPEQHINPNKELPEELISLSNKYFFRLIDLGHTIRKRPNFTNNLEKTLSEIRAALDEIFEKDLDKKEVFYPPKAIGEGSRSKAHSFALTKLDIERLEFLGK